MVQLQHKTLVIIAGVIWMTVGMVLMPLGLHFLELCITSDVYTPLLTSLLGLVSNPGNAVVCLIAVALIVGQLKGRTVMVKVASREVSRIRTLPEPAPLKDIFSPRFYMLMVFMMSLGMGMNFLGVPLDIRGTIDVTVGIALIQGALAYFRLIKTIHAHA